MFASRSRSTSRVLAAVSAVLLAASARTAFFSAGMSASILCALASLIITVPFGCSMRSLPGIMCIIFAVTDDPEGNSVVMVNVAVCAEHIRCITSAKATPDLPLLSFSQLPGQQRR